jgi:hypothetical protein
VEQEVSESSSEPANADRPDFDSSAPSDAEVAIDRQTFESPRPVDEESGLISFRESGGGEGPSADKIAKLSFLVCFDILVIGLVASAISPSLSMLGFVFCSLSCSTFFTRFLPFTSFDYSAFDFASQLERKPNLMKDLLKEPSPPTPLP